MFRTFDWAETGVAAEGFFTGVAAAEGDVCRFSAPTADTGGAADASAEFEATAGLGDVACTAPAGDEACCWWKKK